MRRPEAGVTLIEVTVAVTLLALLSVGMALAIRLGLGAYTRTQDKLMFNRRVAGAQRILQQELEGLMPAFVACKGDQSAAGVRTALFQGTPDTMWLASTFSLQQGWRGQPQILQLFVSSGGEDGGVRLVVNEMPYTGAKGAGQYCTGTTTISGTLSRLAQFLPPRTSERTFVLADKLAYCKFSYYTPPGMYAINDPPTWQPDWHSKGWPLAVRIEMAPAGVDPSRLQPISVTAPIHIRRDPEKAYVDDF